MAERWRNQARKLADTAAQADGPTDRTKNKILKITDMTISQAARNAGEQLPWGHHVYPEVVARIIQDAIDAEKATETVSLRQQLENARNDKQVMHGQLLQARKHTQDVESERDTALARVAELEAQCAAMRDALAKSRWCVNEETTRLWDGTVGHSCRESAKAALALLDDALSSTAGTELLARVKELEKDKARLDEIDAMP